MANAAYVPYAPVQPLARLCPGLCYRELAPPPELRASVYTYWELRNSSWATLHYPVAADACMDVYASPCIPDEIIVTGYAPSALNFEIHPGDIFFGIRFYPAVLPRLIRQPAHLLYNTSAPASAVSVALHGAFSAAVDGCSSLEEFATKIAPFIAAAQGRAPLPDTRLDNAIRQILHSRGTLSVETELQAGLSPRQLRRHFLDYVGGSPKSFCSIVRFQHALAHALHGSEAGYFDQAHFIREHKKLAGVVPGALLRAGVTPHR